MVVAWISHYRGLEPVLLLLLLHSPYKIYFCELICSSTLWLKVILYGLHMYFLLLNFSVLLAKVWLQYLQPRSSSMCSCIRVRDARKSLHFLKLNFPASNKVVFFLLLKPLLFCSLPSSISMFFRARTFITAESTGSDLTQCLPTSNEYECWTYV